MAKPLYIPATNPYVLDDPHELFNFIRATSVFSKKISVPVSISADYTVKAEVYWIRVDASGGAITVTLPPVGEIGRPIGVIKTDSSANVVTIDGAGTETINGATTQTLVSQYTFLIMVDNGTSWDIKGRFDRINVIDAAADTTTWPLLVGAATGVLSPLTDAGFTYNASTNALTTTTFIGNLTGDASGSAATVTTAAQPAITSVGTLTSLQVDNININGNTISSTAGTDLNITPLAGQQLVLDNTIIIDAGNISDVTLIEVNGIYSIDATLNDNQAGYIEFTATGHRGIAVLSGNTSTAGSALVAFRVGDNIFTGLLASSISAGAVAVTTGALTGTTGTDGNLTISVTLSATGNRLYIENRAAGVRAYRITFLSLVGELSGIFTTV